MEYTNSSLVDCEIKSPNNSGRRTQDVDRITRHCGSRSTLSRRDLKLFSSCKGMIM